MAERLQIRGAAGGELDVELSGPPDGVPLVFHTGTPSAGAMFASWIASGVARDVRHIAYSRPGYGASERQAGRSVADCAADVAAIADELGVERFLTVGWSGGGPHALACAALLPERTIAAATIAGVAPANAAGLDWLEGMGAENVEEFAAAAAGERELQPYLEGHGAALRVASGAEIAASLGDLVSARDRDALTGEFADYLARSIRTGLAHGIWGWLDDDFAFVREWGFALDSITRPVMVWQGSEDRFVPFGHGRWLAANVPGATAHLLDGEGHVSILLTLYDSILDSLLGAVE